MLSLRARCSQAEAERHGATAEAASIRHDRDEVAAALQETEQQCEAVHEVKEEVEAECARLVDKLFKQDDEIRTLKETREAFKAAHQSIVASHMQELAAFEQKHCLELVALCSEKDSVPAHRQASGG